MEAANASDREEILGQCRVDRNLGTYKPVQWLRENVWGCNWFIHNCDVSIDEAQPLSRLLVGGQDLRGGDPKVPRSCTPSTCCVFCLERGTFTSETLLHVVFEC